jgi:hypothetical protein
MKRQFLSRLDRPFFWPAAGLTPETYINNQCACCPEEATFSERSLGKSLGVLVTYFLSYFQFEFAG